MAIQYKFSRSDRVFTCQVGMPEHGSWGTVVCRRHDFHPATKAPWYSVRDDDGGTMCTHESWLNQADPRKAEAVAGLEV